MRRKIVSGIMLSLLLIAMLILTFNIQPVKASGTIYIKADGSIDPSTANITSTDNVTYYFTDNNYGEIVVERDNIVVDGAGYIVQGTGTGNGFSLSGRSNVTVKNIEIKAFGTGIYIDSSFDITISGNNITANDDHGIWLHGSWNCTISGNNVTGHTFSGIWLWVGCYKNNVFGNNLTNNGDGVRIDASNNVVSENNITNNGYGIHLQISSNNIISRNNITNNSIGISFRLSSNNVLRGNSMDNNRYSFRIDYDEIGLSLSDFINDVDTSNTVDGKPVYYWVSRRDLAVPLNAGYVALVNCTNITVQDLNLANNIPGILLAYTTDSMITGNNVIKNWDGIWLWESPNITIATNKITNNGDGIHLRDSSNSTISGNTITNNSYGIDLRDSSNSTIFGNTITKNDQGIFLHESSNNIISGNNITANIVGLEFQCSNSNILSGNIIANSWCGFALLTSSNNKFYHNNFIGNILQVYIVRYGYANFWDNGYPSGGNYWSDYTGVDVKSGPNQDQPSSDGIGDTAYVNDANNTDHYPLMYPWGSPPPPSYTLTIYSLPLGVTFTVDGISRTTPWSGTYSEGASVSLEMPATHDGYVWDYWSGTGTNRIKTVTMDKDITLTAVYTRPLPYVGGKATPINIPMNKPETPTLWIWLTTIILPLIATAVFIKHKKKKQ